MWYDIILIFIYFYSWPIVIFCVVGYVILKKKDRRDLEYIASIEEKECNIVKTLESKTKLFAKPKKSIFYLTLKCSQQILILGKKTVDGIEWNKIETEKGEKGWCLLQ